MSRKLESIETLLASQASELDTSQQASYNQGTDYSEIPQLGMGEVGPAFLAAAALAVGVKKLYDRVPKS